MLLHPEIELEKAAQRGIEWILTQQRRDGSFCAPKDGKRGYYKVPYALVLHGKLHQALMLAEWIEVHHVRPEGDFGDLARRSREPGGKAWPVYANAWLVQGLHRLGCWDLARQGMGFLLRHQTASGGFCALGEDGAPFIEPVCTSWGGLAALQMGHDKSARCAGDLLVRMAMDQPEKQRFYFRMDVEGQLITETPEGAALNYYVDTGRREQIYFNPGIALIFLAQLYRATRDEKYLEACRALFAFTQRCAADVYAFPPSGKLGLGCALLYALTHDPEPRGAALELGRYLVETQTPEGFWTLPDAGPYAGKPLDSFDVRLDLTAEFSIFLKEIAARI
jgi:hypothetical protein